MPAEKEISAGFIFARTPLLPGEVRVVGVEPTRLAAQDPKSCLSANSNIPAEKVCKDNYFFRLSSRAASISASTSALYSSISASKAATSSCWYSWLLSRLPGKSLV